MAERRKMREIISRRFRSYYDNRKSKTCAEPSRRTETLKWLELSVIAFVLVAGGGGIPAATSLVYGRFDWRCASLGTKRERTSSSNTDPQTGSSTACRSWQPSLFA